MATILRCPVSGNIITAIALGAIVSLPVLASDIEREQRLAREIADNILDGEVVYLEGDDHSFLNIYTETAADISKGAVIILHGRGFHPDWEDTVKPLRVGLTEKGWNTLSMQMPVLEKAAKYNDYVPILAEATPRIEAGIEYLKQQGAEKIIIVAHSCSVHMVMNWIDAGRFSGVDAFVGIGMGATDYKQPMVKPFPLDKITVPVLDVFGSDDYPAVLRGEEERRRLVKAAGNPKSSQVIVPEANHYFTDQGGDLLEVVSQWLETI